MLGRPLFSTTFRYCTCTYWITCAPDAFGGVKAVDVGAVFNAAAADRAYAKDRVHARFMVLAPSEGVEPPTSAFEARHSNPLNYEGNPYAHESRTARSIRIHGCDDTPCRSSPVPLRNAARGI